MVARMLKVKKVPLLIGDILFVWLCDMMEWQAFPEMP